MPLLDLTPYTALRVENADALEATIRDEAIWLYDAPARTGTRIVFDTTAPGTDGTNTVYLFVTRPIGSPMATIDWGDGATTPVPEAALTSAPPITSHTYTGPLGVHEVYIEGGLGRMGSTSQTAVRMAPLVAITQWDPAGVKDLTNAFYHCFKNYANPGYVAPPPPGLTSLNQTFNNASSFNGDVSGWDTSQVTSMALAFANTSVFNGDLSRWDTSKVTSMSSMFASAGVFNGDVSGWDTSQVTSMSSMFTGARKFNRDISRWNTSKVTAMTSMFQNASVFVQDLSCWNVALIPTAPNYFASGTSASWTAAMKPVWGTTGCLPIASEVS